MRVRYGTSTNKLVDRRSGPFLLARFGASIIRLTLWVGLAQAAGGHGQRPKFMILFWF